MLYFSVTLNPVTRITTVSKHFVKSLVHCSAFLSTVKFVLDNFISPLIYQSKTLHLCPVSTFVATWTVNCYARWRAVVGLRILCQWDLAQTGKNLAAEPYHIRSISIARSVHTTDRSTWDPSKTTFQTGLAKINLRSISNFIPPSTPSSPGFRSIGDRSQSAVWTGLCSPLCPECELTQVTIAIVKNDRNSCPYDI